MKKTILSLAVAAGLAASGAAFAAPTVYGNVHVSVLQFDTANNGNMFLTSNTSSVGVKGAEDLGAGLKAIYKAEFQFDATSGGYNNLSGTTTNCVGGAIDPVCTTTNKTTSNGNALTQRDVWAGLAGSMGSVKIGTMSSNYKQKGGKVDALYRTPAEGRGFINTQSDLHSGRATNRGRMTNTVQYSSPKMGGMQVVVNTTVSGSDDETVGAGFRYDAKQFMVYADYIDTAPSGGSISTAATETATKIGGKFNADAFFVGAQFESSEDVVGYDYVHVNAGFLIDANNIITATIGSASHINDSTQDTDGLALAYDHKMSKSTDVYVAYIDRSSDTASKEDSAFAAGLRIKF
ncbi:MAG: porin [Gammaproteobacteria bacterium]|nr:porin [Gammaproteobacteria bacterium]